jgi:hypothetical protein
VVIRTVPVRIRGQVAGVNGYVLTHLGMLAPQRGEHVIHALAERAIVTLAQLAREAVTRPLRRNATEKSRKTVMFGDEPNDAVPSRDRIQGFDEAHPDHKSERFVANELVSFATPHRAKQSSAAAITCTCSWVNERRRVLASVAQFQKANCGSYSVVITPRYRARGRGLLPLRARC